MLDLSSAPIPWPREALPEDTYVYAIVIDGVRRYVGQGCGRRCFSHEKVARSPDPGTRERRFYKALRLALHWGQAVDIEILAQALERHEAMAMEHRVIHLLGRCGIEPGGVLFNLQDGTPYEPRSNGEEAQLPLPGLDLHFERPGRENPPNPPNPPVRRPAEAPEQLAFLEGSWLSEMAGIRQGPADEGELTASLRRTLQDPANLHRPAVDPDW